MRATALLLLAFATAAFAADLKPGEQLPWCRLTLNMAATIDRDPPKIIEVDGWYDESTHTLIEAKVDPFGAGPLDEVRIVKVTKGAFAPQPMSKEAVQAVNGVRAKAAKEAAAKAAASK